MDLPVPPSSSVPPFLVQRPALLQAPVVFASPHSGRNYSADFLQAARLAPPALRRSEDSFVDELFDAAPRCGLPLLSATFPRAWCDPNREAWELDPAMFDDALPSWVNTGSARVGAGLGTIARVVASGETIYRRKLRFSEAEQRIRHCWQPYHQALGALIAECREAFGACLLVDCHSMPAGGAGRDAPDFVLGDAHGTACAPRVTRHVERTLAAQGYAVRRNEPYAGGYVTRHYGRPRDGVHALQLEIARPLYMDEQHFTHLPRFAALQRDLAALVASLAENAAGLMGG